MRAIIIVAASFAFVSSARAEDKKTASFTCGSITYHVDYEDKTITWSGGNTKVPVQMSDKFITWQTRNDYTKATTQFELDRYSLKLHTNNPNSKPPDNYTQCQVVEKRI